MFVSLLFVFCVSSAFAFSPFRNFEEPSQINGDVGDKLILTPYIESGQIQKAQNLSSVPPLVGQVKSHSGFLTVNKTCGSNMFFWYFPAQNNDPKAPIVIWLQGGPGGTSLYGLFTELGAFELTPENKLVERKFPWSREASLIFFDNPVGTGYSYTEKEECYAKTQTDVGRDLLNALKQVLKLFPEQSSNPLFVTGESYAGKYAPALAYAIHNDKSSPKINLQGIAIGSGLVDPQNQLVHYDLLHQLGLFDVNERERALKMEQNCQNLITQKKWIDAFNCFDEFMAGDFVKYPTYFKNVTGFNYYHHLLYPNGQPEGKLVPFVTSEKIRKSIHVGNATWHDGKTVEKYLMADVMQSIIPWLVEVLNNYRVLLYTGQMDLILGYPTVEAYLQKMQWSGAAAYKKAKGHMWYVDKELAGYSKTAEKLTLVLVRNAGHMVPRDQPKWAFDMISKFLKNKPFF